MITIHVKLFAAARQAAGTESLQLELPEDSTVADLRTVLKERSPELAGLLDWSMIAVNEEYREDTAKLRAGDVAACIPPVSGG